MRFPYVNVSLTSLLHSPKLETRGFHTVLNFRSEWQTGRQKCLEETVKLSNTNKSFVQLAISKSIPWLDSRAGLKVDFP